MTDTIKMENNTLTFKYFKEKSKNSEWRFFDKNIQGLRYKAESKKCPYLTTENKLISFDDQEMEREIIPYNFLISGLSNQSSCNFLINEHLKKVKTGTPVFEIRTMKEGVWQNWQAIIGEFSLYKVLSVGGKNYFGFLFEKEIDELRNFFDIRYSGILLVFKFKNPQIYSQEDGITKTFDRQTREIQFYPDYGNQSYAFEERMEDLKNFENKYFSYDSEGNRI